MVKFLGLFFNLCKNGHLHIGKGTKGSEFCNETGRSQYLHHRLFHSKNIWDES